MNYTELLYLYLSHHVTAIFITKGSACFGQSSESLSHVCGRMIPTGSTFTRHAGVAGICGIRTESTEIYIPFPSSCRIPSPWKVCRSSISTANKVSERIYFLPDFRFEQVIVERWGPEHCRRHLRYPRLVFPHEMLG